eukprot:scaffold7614_cov417-Prasinococcus_capsulatus_cf.AAC.5
MIAGSLCRYFRVPGRECNATSAHLRWASCIVVVPSGPRRGCPGSNLSGNGTRLVFLTWRNDSGHVRLQYAHAHWPVCNLSDPSGMLACHARGRGESKRRARAQLTLGLRRSAARVTRHPKARRGGEPPGRSATAEGYPPRRDVSAAACSYLSAGLVLVVQVDEPSPDGRRTASRDRVDREYQGSACYLRRPMHWWMHEPVT